MTLKDRIEELEKQLENEKKHTYVGQTNSLHCADGELHISYGNYPDDERYLVMDIEQLYKDLPFIVNQIVKEQNNMQKYYLDNIKSSIESL